MKEDDDKNARKHDIKIKIEEILSEEYGVDNVGHISKFPEELIKRIINNRILSNRICKEFDVCIHEDAPFEMSCLEEWIDEVYKLETKDR